MCEASLWNGTKLFDSPVEIPRNWLKLFTSYRVDAVTKTMLYKGNKSKVLEVIWMVGTRMKQHVLQLKHLPGNGCLLISSLGTPRSIPIDRTSSLWKAFKGSITLPWNTIYSKHIKFNTKWIKPRIWRSGSHNQNR